LRDVPSIASGIAYLFRSNVTSDRDIFHHIISAISHERYTIRRIAHQAPSVREALGNNRSIRLETRMMDCGSIPRILHLQGNICSRLCDSCL
jgi:hypothetical protein